MSSSGAVPTSLTKLGRRGYMSDWAFDGEDWNAVRLAFVGDGSFLLGDGGAVANIASSSSSSKGSVNSHPCTRWMDGVREEMNRDAGLLRERLRVPAVVVVVAGVCCWRFGFDLDGVRGAGAGEMEGDGGIPPCS